MPSKSSDRLQRSLDRIERAFPAAARTIRWLRQPNMALVRIPLAILLILGGVFSFLPVLGIWMLPLGLIFLSIDLSVLQGPVARAMIGLQRRWRVHRRQGKPRKRK